MRPSSDSTCQTGRQYTPVASIATWVQRCSSNHDDGAIKPGVVVANVSTARVGALVPANARPPPPCPCERRARRTGDTEPPCQPPLRVGRRRMLPGKDNLNSALQSELLTQARGLQGTGSNSYAGCRAPRTNRPLRRRPIHDATGFIRKGPPKPVGTHTSARRQTRRFRQHVTWKPSAGRRSSSATSPDGPTSLTRSTRASCGPQHNHPLGYAAAMTRQRPEDFSSGRASTKAAR